MAREAQGAKREEQNVGNPRKAKKEALPRKISQDTELNGYQLGDCLGKGAFGSVFRALNMNTGETVAVKQIKLTDLPKSELRVITLEIDLLSNLNHANIVKYHGSVKSSESLNIILEYCENGSLHSISKNFGKFPENLVAIYMSQILHGLLYLHEQGVIHRDIKGANILTTKEGLVKLADFGVATRTTTLHESSVVGTPYWMAPEVIELSGATTASDIWSLGCTVIELLDGKPPYHKLQPMHALFRIVNDDHPPLPEGASPVVRDFLMQCFQKDPNLRVSAKKLLKHPWIVSARRSGSVVPQRPIEYEEAVKSVQQWNEALKSPDATLRKAARQSSASPVPPKRPRPTALETPARNNLSFAKPHALAEQFRSPDGNADDNWDDDFASAISPSALQLPHLKPQDHFDGMLSAEKLKTFASFETVTEDVNWDGNLDGNATLKNTSKTSNSDPLKTVRPYIANRTSSTKPSKESRLYSPEKKPSKAALRSKPVRQVQKQERPAQTPAEPLRNTLQYREDSLDDFSDLVSANAGTFEQKLSQHPSLNSPAHPHRLVQLPNTPTLAKPLRRDLKAAQASPSERTSIRRTKSSVEIERYAEDEQDEDFSDIFGKEMSPTDKPDSDGNSEGGTFMLNSKLSTDSWLGDDDDDDDPFAQLEETFDETDLEANVARDRYARLCTQVGQLVGSLKLSQSDDVLASLSEDLLEILYESPDTKGVIFSSHGMLPILEILESSKRRDIILNLLRIVNMSILSEVEIQENLCFVGGIPIITKFASKKYPSEIRLEAAVFVRQMCETSILTLQMFVSAGGLKVLVEFLEEDYEEERELVMIGVNGVWSVFELQGPTPKNDFCRILSRSAVLDPLSLVLSRVLDESGDLAELCEGRIANIFLLFSQAENHVKELISERTVLHRVLKELKRMSPPHQITMLKFIKNLSMLSTTLDALQNSNAIDVLSELLRTSMKESHFREMSNQILNTIYNLCRLNKSRQEDAALNDIIPILQKIYKTERPLKEFALPILCDMAHSGKVGRRELWRNKGLQFYISLLSDPYWQVTALDSIFMWLQEETARVEEHLLDGNFTEAITRCFSTAKANAFEGSLEPLQKLLRLSPPIALSLAQPEFFSRILQKLSSNKALTRLNLLRIVQSICDASEEHGALITMYGLYDTIQALAEKDSAILVRDMASKLIRSCEEQEFVLKSGGGDRRRAALRRTSSSTTASTPPGFVAGSTNSQSMPPTPSSAGRVGRSSAFFVDRERGSRNVNANISSQSPTPLQFRSMAPVAADESPVLTPTIGSTQSSIAARSRLPRTTALSSRSSRPSLHHTSPRKEEHHQIPSSPTHSPRQAMIPNSRRRRQTSSGEPRSS